MCTRHRVRVCHAPLGVAAVTDTMIFSQLFFIVSTSILLRSAVPFISNSVRAFEWICGYISHIPHFLLQRATRNVSLQDIYVAAEEGTLDQYGIDQGSWSWTGNMQMVFTMLGKWAGSHWMDQDLSTEFWMKNYDEVQGHGKWDVRGQHDWFELFWNRVRD